MVSQSDVSDVGAARIVAAIVDAARRWCDADFAPRVRATAAVMKRTGYSEPVVDYALDRAFEVIERPALEAVIASELGSLAALDGFLVRPERSDVWFRGGARVVIVSSDTTIGVALPALIFALCAKARITVKDRDDGLVAAFVATLGEEEPALAERVQVAHWHGEDLAASRTFLDEADVVVAYGRDKTLGTIRNMLSPRARFIGFGHRTSIGYVARETLRDEAAARDAARAAALDGLLYDGDGCLSLHALFVERCAAVEPAHFARMLARACDEIAIEFPAGYVEPDAAVLAYRRAALFRAAQGHGIVYGGIAGPHVVAYDAPQHEPPPLLRRTLAVYPIDSPSGALAFVRRHAVPLEAFARTDERRGDIEAAALESGASRITRLGLLQSPPLGGEHGGEQRILPFVRAIYRE